MEIMKKFEPLWGVWKCESVLGEGGFGRVYKAVRNDGPHAYYSAIKHISVPANEQQLQDARRSGLYRSEKELSDYFNDIALDVQHEIDLMYALKANTNIVSYEDHLVVPKSDGIGYDIFIRMELLRDLSSIPEKDLTQNEAIKIGIDICSALEVCAKSNIIHRDIKPSNIFVNANGDYKLGDFGIARVLGSTTSGVSKKGTYSYMAPEIYKCEPANLTSDIYSLGVVLYRILNENRLPFMPLTDRIRAQDHETALLKMVSGAPMPPPVNATPQMAAVILKACAYNKRDRFRSATEFKKALNEVLIGSYSSPAAVSESRYDSTVAEYTVINREDRTQVNNDTKIERKSASMQAGVPMPSSSPHGALNSVTKRNGIFKGIILAETAVLAVLFLMFGHMGFMGFWILGSAAIVFQYILCRALDEKKSAFRAFSVFSASVVLSAYIPLGIIFYNSVTRGEEIQSGGLLSVWALFGMIMAEVSLAAIILHTIFVKQKRNCGWLSLMEIIISLVIFASIASNGGKRLIYAIIVAVVSFILISMLYVYCNTDKSPKKTFERIFVIEIIAYMVLFALISHLTGKSIAAALLVIGAIIFFVQHVSFKIWEKTAVKFQIVSGLVLTFVMIVVGASSV